MDIRPFRGWRFAGPEISSQIAPPYDVLQQADKDGFLAADATNIVAVDLPHMPPKTVGPDAAYQAAAKRLAQWQADGTLVQADAPAMYVYEQSYSWAGVEYVRRAVLAGVRATPLGEDVIPHEHTFDGPKADRLKLTQETHMQLSPIFGFYNDPIGTVDVLRASAGEPIVTAELQGVTEKLWAVTDAAAIGQVQDALANVPVYIADGHHRYTTAMNYRDQLRDAGEIDSEHEANFVLFALVAGDDAGLIVLPTHRVAAGLTDAFSPQALADALGDAFEVAPMADAAMDLSDADAALSPIGTHGMALAWQDQLWSIRLVNADAMTAVAPDQPQPWRDLDVAILQELILDRALTSFKSDDFQISYTPDGNAARSQVQSGQADAAFLLQSTAVAAVEAVADAPASMPHKSTYFYPKLATGMILKPVE